MIIKLNICYIFVCVVLFPMVIYLGLKYHHPSTILFSTTYKDISSNLSQETILCEENEVVKLAYKKRMEGAFKRIKQNISEINFVSNFPLLIHFIWLSHDIRKDNTVDKTMMKNIGTFQIYEKSGWHIIIWDNKRIHSNYCPDTTSNKELCEILTNESLIKKCNLKIAMKADLLRYMIVFDFGGMYFDCDFIALRNMEHILLDMIKNHGLIVARENTDPYNLSNGFFAASPQNIYLEKAKNLALVSIKGSARANTRTGPFFFKKAVLSAFFKMNINDKNIIKQFNLSSIASVLPTNYLYAWPYSKRSNKTMLQEVKKFPTTYFIHLWAKSWHKK